MNKILSYKLILINIFFTLFYFFINSKSGYIYDGIPFNSKIETITLLCIIPFLLIFNCYFLNSKKISYILILLILLKFLGYLYLPQKGLFFDAYSNLDKELIAKKIVKIDPKKQNKYANEFLEKIDKYDDNYINKINLYKTFNSIWNKNNTALVTKQLINKHEFPLDWARGLNLSEWRELAIDFYLTGNVHLYQNEFLIIELNEVINITDLNKLFDRIIFINNINEIDTKNLPNDNINNINIKLENLKISYNKYDWKFNAQIYNVEKNIFLDAFGNNRFLIDNHKEKKVIKNIVSYIVLATEVFIVIFLCFWFLISFFNFINKYKNYVKVFNFISLSVISSILPLFIFYLFYESPLNKTFRNIDATYISPLGFSCIIIFVLLLIFKINKKPFNDSLKEQIYVMNKFSAIIFIIPILAFFSITQSYSIVEIINYPLEGGDDWSTIFNISKFIAVYGDFLPARYCVHDMHNTFRSEYPDFVKIEDIRNIFCKEQLGSIYHHNPLYRYLLSFLSALFGHGSFIVRILDVWCIIVVIYFGIYFLINSRINYNYIYLFIFIYLFINFFGPSRYLIGRGKEEFVSMAFIVLASMFFYNGKQKNLLHLYLGIICALIALHTRLDKILIILSLISFYFEPIRGSLINVYNSIFNIIKNRIFFILTFIIIICLSLNLLFLRHYVLLGEIIFVHPSSMEITMNKTVSDKIVNFIKTIYYVLSSADFWPDKPKFPSVVLFIGTFYLIFLSIYRNSKIENIIIPSFSLISIVMIASFYFFHASAYPPRWSTHILPFSTIGFVYFIFNLIPARLSIEQK